MVVFLLSLVMAKLFGSSRLNMVELLTVLVGYRLLMTVMKHMYFH